MYGEMQRVTESEEDRRRKRDKQSCRSMGRWTDGEINKGTGEKTEGHTEGEMDRCSDRKIKGQRNG
jgi:hypothetical protein